MACLPERKSGRPILLARFWREGGYSTGGKVHHALVSQSANSCGSKTTLVRSPATHKLKSGAWGEDALNGKADTKSWLALAGFGAAVAGAAWFGSRYSPRDARTKLWYDRLDKPSYNPPQYVFPIVWSSLYTLIAISGWRVWREEDSNERSHALALWAGQLASNAE